MPKEAKNKENKANKTAKERKHFFKDTKAELKKVIWPTSKQLVNNTLAVIAVVLLVGIIVFVLDVCFEKVNELGVNGLKTIVQSTTNNTQTNTETNTLENTSENTLTTEEQTTENAE